MQGLHLLLFMFLPYYAKKVNIAVIVPPTPLFAMFRDFQLIVDVTVPVPRFISFVSVPTVSTERACDFVYTHPCDTLPKLIQALPEQVAESAV